AEYAALAIRPVGMAEDGDKHTVCIMRIDENGGDLLPIAQAEMLPGATRVAGLIDSVAGGKVWPSQAFAAADINHVRIRRSNRQRADGTSGLIVKNRVPGSAIVIGLPHSAVVRRHVEHIRLRRNPGDGDSASRPE